MIISENIDRKQVFEGVGTCECQDELRAVISRASLRDSLKESGVSCHRGHTSYMGYKSSL